MKDSSSLMGTAPIPLLILRFAVPATVGLLANALYNIVDRIFIGHYAGAPGLAAISVVFPIVMVSVSFASLVGTGTASQISRDLGAGKQPLAQKAFGNGIFASLAFNAAFVSALMARLPQIVRLCGATEHIAPLAETYMRITGSFIPAAFLGMVLMSSMRAEGHPQHAMWGMVLASLLNVVLDWCFVAGLGMGVAGAAWATAASQVFALLWIAVFYARRSGELRVSAASMRPDMRILAETVAVGLSPFLFNIFFSVMMMIFNLLLRKHGGELALSAMSVFFGVDSLLYMPVTGIGEGAMPLIGYNYGARRFDRLRRTVKIALVLSVAYYIIAEASAMTWAEEIARIFSSDDPELIARAARCMRIGYAALPFSGIAIVTGNTLEALGRARTAFCFNITRQLYALTMIYPLSELFGVDGVWMPFPSVDLLAGIIALFLLRREARNWR